VVKEIEEELISRCQQGDQDALKEIFELYQKKVYRIAYGVVRHREDALEIVQEVFIKLFRTIKNFKGESRFYTYLYRMAMNTAIDFARKTKKMPTLTMDDESGFTPPDDPEKRPDRVAAQKELQSKVNWALEQLPQEQRAAILFREVEGLSYQEIADTMGCSIGTVMSRLHYGRRKVQQMLEPYLHEGRGL